MNISIRLIIREVLMKTLTIKEPWATLIINGYKKYEFRSWKTNYRGRIFIHAGKGIDKDMICKLDKYNLDLSYGEIIGEAVLVDCIKVDKTFDTKLRNIDKKIYINNHVGLYAWKLENVKKFDVKIPIKGQLGLWNYEE